MSASQRVSRGSHRLAVFSAVSLIGGLATSPASAEITDPHKLFSMLCVAEKGTGFVWEKNDWVQTNFQAQPYVLNKLEPDNKICTLFWGVGAAYFSQPITPDGVGGGSSKGCYELKEVGRKNSHDVPNTCDERWSNPNGTGYVLRDESVEALPISGQKLTVASSSQERMDFGMRASNETPWLLFGKCSLVNGP